MSQSLEENEAFAPPKNLPSDEDTEDEDDDDVPLPAAHLGVKVLVTKIGQNKQKGAAKKEEVNGNVKNESEKKPSKAQSSPAKTPKKKTQIIGTPKKTNGVSKPNKTQTPKAKAQTPKKREEKPLIPSKFQPLPAATVKRLLKTKCPGVGLISSEALPLLQRTAEMFIGLVAKLADKHRVSTKRKRLMYDDLAEVVNSDDRFDVIQRIVPKRVLVSSLPASAS
uniref:Transcription factor CBF/NF-Y/archaeal histone domain-containing protein n=1 Tax=Palpitomonas bilix TaxID=652834 RepID=A0A7S3GCB0_9EUKA|mmetsp:Transcript_42231/g.108760  ORF Transcript_42231/g.108760 Transcript_42231/m.108760 type:complete len:223 (+) Transcript_42231:167-835(+)|eukprot:CAMPEP_0113868948 /NCGR_PEP_ID=MMETSP0780_2-20120614/1269_1 /TAXON_ID=652834 /ORGANISM="Palpitomonas bilix" /LENGTH=222 /DNA_ID=CAMNT_0000854081 /DNA_START=161 /DNA_END=829 /DNA_ORIENTATION=- /assembly_acc=CAM_ASM_000599